jgi:hypothetical protein
VRILKQLDLSFDIDVRVEEHYSHPRVYRQSVGLGEDHFCQNRALRQAVNFKTCLDGAGYVADFGIFEDGSVKFRRLFGLTVKP